MPRRRGAKYSRDSIKFDLSILMRAGKSRIPCWIAPAEHRCDQALEWTRDIALEIAQEQYVN